MHTLNPSLGKSRASCVEGQCVAEQLQAGVWITAACVCVAEGCFELAGSRTAYESSPLQRRVRDLRVAAQQVVAHPRHYVMAGAAVLARLSCVPVP
jgi:hypothetical protein